MTGTLFDHPITHLGLPVYSQSHPLRNPAIKKCTPLDTGRVFAMNGVERGRVAFIPSMHDQWAVGRSPFEKLLTMGSVPDSPTARSARGLPEAGQIMIFRAPDECLR